MTNKRLKDFTGLSGYTNLAADDLVYVADHSSADGERKVVLSDIKNYVLAGKTVGGEGPGDIVDRDSAQRLTQKTLTSPTINTPVINTPAISAATLTGTTVLPATTSIGTVSATEIGHLDGVTRAIQTQLNELAAQISTPTKRVWPYGIKFTASGTSKTITAATLLAATGLTGYLVNPQGIEIQLYSVSGGTYTKLSVAATYSIDVTTTTSAGVERVSEIKVSGITNAVDYMISVQFTLVWDPA